MSGPNNAGATDSVDVKRLSTDDDYATVHATEVKARPTFMTLSQPVPSESTVSDVDEPDTPTQFYVEIGKGPGSLLKALKKLDKILLEANKPHILSKKKPVSWIGRKITQGQIGLVDHGGHPKILTEPGRYPRFPLGNWWGRSFEGHRATKDTVIEFNGLTVVQVSQNQVAVVSDPQGEIFSVKDGGFVALATEGSYTVLSVFDQTRLSNSQTDPTTKATLGHWQEVKMRSRMGPSNTAFEFVVATFLNIGANNCAVLQNVDKSEILPAGQHFITTPNTTLRKMFTYNECQTEISTKDILTKDRVPVVLTCSLKWELTDPLKLTNRGYDTPSDALRDKTQSILTQIISHSDYSSMDKRRSIDPKDTVDDKTNSNTAFLEDLQSRAMKTLKTAAEEYGIALKDFAVIDRQFKGEIASAMDKLTTRALQAQVEAASVDKENDNRVKKEEGSLKVAETQADAEAYAIIAKANAMAEATRIAARADADAIGFKATADQAVQDDFAREMRLRRNEVERIAAYGNKTVFVPVGGAAGSGAADAVTLGFAAGIGSDMRKDWGAEQQQQQQQQQPPPPPPPPPPQQLGGTPKPPAK
ncbi:hypothetical protein FRC04_002210 [Tulasnella sp. 424]|nr:hypothetical protein FRC04_002210 [Tulasnella sp. 424]KAG8967756.1 hypothetical protein FRC05_001935 [Tulasnella sp. 425]